MRDGGSAEPYNELEEFYSIWEALQWKQIRTRVPICFRKTIRNRYMLANIIFLIYCIIIVINNYHPKLQAPSPAQKFSPLDSPVRMVPLANTIFVGQ